MAKVFISHSSTDQRFARGLASDIAECGHLPWLDEWEIKVGECIVTRVERGIDEADYVVIVLSQHSVKSGWVEKEWKTKYWQEIETGNPLVLPVLLEDCEIPALLRTKRYADFRKNHSTGLVALMAAISPTLKRESSRKPISSNLGASDISKVIARVHSKSVSLSESVAEALDLAIQSNNFSLRTFCSNELKGWDADSLREFVKGRPGYRLMEVFVSVSHKVNMQYFGLPGNPFAVLEYLRNDIDNFTNTKMLYPHPVSEVENSVIADPSRFIIQLTMTLSAFLPETEYPNATAYAYCQANTFSTMLDQIRNELTRQLLDSMPDIQVVTGR